MNESWSSTLPSRSAITCGASSRSASTVSSGRRAQSCRSGRLRRPSIEAPCQRKRATFACPRRVFGAFERWSLRWTWSSAFNCPAWVQAGQLKALLQVHLSDHLSKAPNTLRGHAKVARFRWHGASIDGRRNRPDRQDCARRPDDTVEADLDDAPQVIADLLGNVLDQLSFIPSADRI